MFTLYDGRSHFWQWDANQKLVTTTLPVGTEVHFYHDKSERLAFTMLVEQERGARVCKVPNALMEHAGTIKVYVYTTDATGTRTTHRKTFAVKPRQKPPGYVYTETETYTLKTALQKAVNEIKVGPPGRSVSIQHIEQSNAPGGESIIFFSDGTELAIQNGKDGESITVTNAEESTESGALNKITFSDGKRINIRNGLDGRDGAEGPRGPQGIPGRATKTRVNPVTLMWEYSEDDGITWISSDLKAVGPQGPAGKDGRDGVDGYTPVKDVDYFDGAPGQPGKDGVDGQPGVDGRNGTSIIKIRIVEVQ